MAFAEALRRHSEPDRFAPRSTRQAVTEQPGAQPAAGVARQMAVLLALVDEEQNLRTS